MKALTSASLNPWTAKSSISRKLSLETSFHIPRVRSWKPRRARDKAVSEAICGTSTFRFIDWKEAVNNWDKLSRGDQRGSLQGVQLPSV